MLLFYRDALDCVEYLFGNPIFANGIDFSPTRLYRNMEQMIRVYTEWMTGDAAWKMQVSFRFYLRHAVRHLTLFRKCSQMVQHS